jgi:hypothetical protein
VIPYVEELFTGVVALTATMFTMWATTRIAVGSGKRAEANDLGSLDQLLSKDRYQSEEVRGDRQARGRRPKKSCSYCGGSAFGDHTCNGCGAPAHGRVS